MRHGHHGGDCCRNERHGGRFHGRYQNFHRRYVSPEEEKEMIVKYIEELKKEIAGAEARLAELP